MRSLILAVLVLATPLGAADFKAGTARVNITPPLPYWLNGYARTNPATSVHTELWAKALALTDDHGSRVVIITSDVIGIPRDVSEAIGEGVRKQYGFERSQLLLNFSHTHYGPVIGANYCNEVCCYIPSLRVLHEGGYEVERSMTYYGQPGPFGDKVEDQIFQAVHQVMESVVAGKPEHPTVPKTK